MQLRMKALFRRVGWVAASLVLEACAAGSPRARLEGLRTPASDNPDSGPLAASPTAEMLARQAQLLEVGARLEALESETFGGYLINGSPPRLVVKFTEGGASRLRRHVPDPALLAWIDVEEIRYSLRELRTAQDAVVRAIRALGVEAQGQVDVTANLAVVYVPDRKAKARVVDAGVPIPQTVKLLPVTFEG